LLDILRYPNMRRKLILININWTVSAFLYFGLTINSVNLAGNMYLNFGLTLLVDFPGYLLICLFLMDRLGRKGSGMVLIIVTGLCSLVAGIYISNHAVTLAFNLAGKMALIMNYAAVFLHVSELFPTEYRATVLGFGMTISRLGAVLASVVVNVSDGPLALYVFAGTALTSSVLFLGLPETTGCVLPATLEESEQFGVDQPLLYFPCFAKTS